MMKVEKKLAATATYTFCSQSKLKGGLDFGNKRRISYSTLRF